MCSCGFCLLNTVAIGAAYARCMYGRQSGPRSNAAMIQKVAIVDIDIHHGNGTEEIVRNLWPRRKTLPLPPSHAPISYETYKPWLDETDKDNVFLASLHLYDDGEGQFYPGGGGAEESTILPSGAGILNIPLKMLRKRASMSNSQRRQCMSKASEEYRRQVSERLIPRLEKFSPDIIFISAGFDGHCDDFYHWLDESDYHWVTAQLVRVAKACCGGRIVSVLEGGYHVSAKLPAKTCAQLQRRRARKLRDLLLRVANSRRNLAGCPAAWRLTSTPCLRSLERLRDIRQLCPLTRLTFDYPMYTLVVCTISRHRAI